MDIEFMNTLIPAIWCQLGCQQSIAAMMKYTDHSDDYKVNAPSLTDSTSTEELSEEVRLLMIELLVIIMAIHQTKFVKTYTVGTIHPPLLCQQYLNILHTLFSDQCPEILSRTIELVLAGIEQYEQCPFPDDMIDRKVDSDIIDSKPVSAENKDLFVFIFDDFAEYLCLALGPSCGHKRGGMRQIALQLMAKIIKRHIDIKQDIPSWITDDDKIWSFIASLTLDLSPSVQDELVSSALQWIMSMVQCPKRSTSNLQMAKVWMLLLNQRGMNQLDNVMDWNLLQCLEYIVPLCKQELSHWKVRHRHLGYDAISALLNRLQYAFPPQFMVELLPLFATAPSTISDDDESNKNECLRLFGRFIPFIEYEQLLLDGIACDSSSSSSISTKSYLLMAKEIFTGFNDESKEKQIDRVVFHRICKTLSDIAASPEIAEEVLSALSALVHTKVARQQLAKESVDEVLWILLQIQVDRIKTLFIPSNRTITDLKLSSDDRLYSLFQSIMLRLGECLNLNTEQSPETVWSEHFESIYSRISFDVVISSEKRYRDYLVFACLVSNVGSFMVNHMESIYSVFRCCNDESKGEKVQSVVMSVLRRSLYCTLNEDEATKSGIKDQDVWMKRIVIDILCPNLSWKPGPFALNMRVSALESLLIMYRGSMLKPEITLNHGRCLVITLLPRMDDPDTETRMLVLQLLDLILNDLGTRIDGKREIEGILSGAEIKKLTVALLDRFDDGEERVRETTCGTVRTLVQCLHGGHEELYQEIMDAALLTLDDTNERLQAKVVDLLKVIRASDSELFQKKVTALMTENVREETRVIISSMLGTHSDSLSTKCQVSRYCVDES